LTGNATGMEASGSVDDTTLYAFDQANRRVVASLQVARTTLAQYRVPSGSPWFSNMTGMVVAPATGSGSPTLLWTESGNLLSASLGPTIFQTPSPVSVFTYVVMSNDSLALIASKFGWSERELKLANPDLDLDHLTVGMEISIPGRFTVSPTPGPADPGLGG